LRGAKKNTIVKKSDDQCDCWPKSHHIRPEAEESRSEGRIDESHSPTKITKNAKITVVKLCGDRYELTWIVHNMRNVRTVMPR
jgi:hypothetical protein